MKSSKNEKKKKKKKSPSGPKKPIQPKTKDSKSLEIRNKKNSNTETKIDNPLAKEKIKGNIKKQSVQIPKSQIDKFKISNKASLKSINSDLNSKEKKIKKKI